MTGSDASVDLGGSAADLAMAAQRDAALRRYANSIVCADAEKFLSRLPDQVIDCVVTSPPYYRQRDYQQHRQLGQEATPEQYVRRLVEIMRHVHRALKTTGSLWLVLGDKYVDGRLLGIPWRVALALQQDGWVLRSDIVWHKPNAMPSPVKSRPTTDHEYIFLLTRSVDYFYNADAVREPHVTFTSQSRMRGGRRHFFRRHGTPENGKNGGLHNLHDGRWDQAFHPKGRNRRTVWSIPLSKFREAHFAVFPEALVETCLKAGCPPGGMVLDPFLGAGTVAVVAGRLQRSFLGIDCNGDYCRMAQRRLEQAGGSSRLIDGELPTELPPTPPSSALR